MTKRFCLLWLFLTVGSYAATEELHITRSRQLPCFLEDERLGFRPKPNCEVRAKTPWSEAITYKTNELGLREKTVPVNPAAGKLRIVLLGPSLEGVGLTDEQMPARQLEKKFKDLKFENVEVLNASVPGFSAGRYAMFTNEIKKNLNPDIVIYYQTGDNFAFDYIEEQKITRDQYNERLQFVAGKTKADMADMSWWDRIGEASLRVKMFWKLYREAQSEADERKMFLAPTWGAMEEISSRFGTGTKFILAWAPRPANNNDVIGALGFGLNFIFQFVTPSIRVSGAMLMREMRQNGPYFILVSKEFNLPVKNGLAPKQNPMVLTAKGAELWAENIVLELRDQIGVLGADDTVSAHIASFQARRYSTQVKRPQLIAKKVKKIEKRVEKNKAKKIAPETEEKAKSN